MAVRNVSALEAEISRLKEALAEKDQQLEKVKMDRVFMKTLFEGIQEEIMVVDDNYLIQDANQSFLQRYGVKKEEVLGRKCHEVTYQSSKPCVFGKDLCPLEKAKETRQRVEVTHQHEFPSWGYKELIRIMYPLSLEDREPHYFIEICRDVTEYRRLVKRAQASEKRFRAILDTATDAILSINEDHKIVMFNDAAEQIFGYARSEVIGKDLGILIPSQYGDHSRHVQRFLETREPRILGKTLSLTALRKSGEEFPIELGLSYRELETGVMFTAIIRDISRQKELEKKLLQSERLAAVGQTVAHVAHEIKNPLMIIGGFSYQIRNSVRDEETNTQKLDMVLEEVGRLEKLVSNLTDFTKEYRLMKRPADINSVLRDVLKIMGEVYPSEKYNFEANLTPKLDEIQCDPDKLKQVFINIISNGIEAMEDGGTIYINTTRYGKGVEIKIMDEGVGISEEEQVHIFEPFYTTRESGSGLGLSISYKIIEAHKGEIAAVSKRGKGTVFSIRLPAD